VSEQTQMIRALCHAVHDPLQEPRRKTLLYFLLELLRSVLAARSSENERAVRVSVCRHALASTVRTAELIGEQLREGGARARAPAEAQAGARVGAKAALRGRQSSSSHRSAAGVTAAMEVEGERGSRGCAAGAARASAADGAESLPEVSAANIAASAKRVASAALQPGGASKKKRKRQRRLARASAAAHDVRLNAIGGRALALAASSSSSRDSAAAALAAEQRAKRSAAALPVVLGVLKVMLLTLRHIDDKSYVARAHAHR